MRLLERVPERVLYCSGTAIGFTLAAQGVRDGSDSADHSGWDTHLLTG